MPLVSVRRLIMIEPEGVEELLRGVEGFAGADESKWIRFVRALSFVWWGLACG
jgi:hypothetical protein